MSAPAETVHLNDTVRDLARRMVDNHRKHLPVVDSSGRLVGVVSRRDLLRMFDRPDAELAADVSDAIAQDQNLVGHAISVIAKDGVVTIEGTVRRADDVAYIRRLAWMVPCVVDVVCHLTVVETASQSNARHQVVGRARVGPARPDAGPRALGRKREGTRQATHCRRPSTGDARSARRSTRALSPD